MSNLVYIYIGVASGVGGGAAAPLKFHLAGEF